MLLLLTFYAAKYWCHYLLILNTFSINNWLLLFKKNNEKNITYNGLSFLDWPRFLFIHFSVKKMFLKFEIDLSIWSRKESTSIQGKLQIEMKDFISLIGLSLVFCQLMWPTWCHSPGNCTQLYSLFLLTSKNCLNQGFAVLWNKQKLNFKEKDLSHIWSSVLNHLFMNLKSYRYYLSLLSSSKNESMKRFFFSYWNLFWTRLHFPTFQNQKQIYCYHCYFYCHYYWKVRYFFLIVWMCVTIESNFIWIESEERLLPVIKHSSSVTTGLFYQ